MAAIPSLALAALGNTSHYQSEEMKGETSGGNEEGEVEGMVFPEMEITITDGHPDAVWNNEVCAAFTLTLCSGDTPPQHTSSETAATTIQSSSLSSSSSSIQTHKLLWKATPEGANECRALLHATTQTQTQTTNHNAYIIWR